MMNNRHWKISGYKQNPILVHYFPSLESTNSEAKRFVMEDAPEWTVVYADLQTQGRGRYNRGWHSPAGLGLYFSVLLRPNIELKLLNLMNLGAALVIREYLQAKLAEVGINDDHAVVVKWPNDILVKEKKICGILLESEVVGQQLKYLILGIGININHQFQDFPVELRKTATSLQLSTHQQWDKSQLLIEILIKLQQKFIFDHETDYRKVIPEYQKYLAFKDQVVEINCRNQRIKGRLKGINPYGYLILEQGKDTRTITTGDLWM
jgi:BirA family biotin operon repressor/biotin-[acetyl-CoA-carboxylase] ligase